MRLPRVPVDAEDREFLARTAVRLAAAAALTISVAGVAGLAVRVFSLAAF